MKTALLDVNLLIALTWPNHQHHKEAKGWFGKVKKRQWASCPITQNAFVRLSSNPAIIENAVSVGESIGVLRTLTAHPGHEFWPDSVDISRTNLPPALLQGYRQLTDAYLIALAAENEGVLVTLDRALINAVRGTEFAEYAVSVWDKY